MKVERTESKGGRLALGEAPLGVLEAVWERLGGAVEASDSPLAVFDADGTLWADDLGETHLAVLQEQGALTPAAGYRSVLAEYHARCAEDVDEGYAWGTRVLASLEEAEVVAGAVEAWRRHRTRLLGPVAGIVRSLISAGVDVAIVSASNRWVIEAAVEELGVSSGRVVAVDLTRESGRLMPVVVQPMPNGPGKVDAIDASLGRRPTIAFGNSVHDAPMLACAEVGVLVLATTAAQPVLSPALEVMRAEHDWAYLAVPHPIEG